MSFFCAGLLAIYKRTALEPISYSKKRRTDRHLFRGKKKQNLFFLTCYTLAERYPEYPTADVSKLLKKKTGQPIRLGMRVSRSRFSGEKGQERGEKGDRERICAGRPVETLKCNGDHDERKYTTIAWLFPVHPTSHTLQEGEKEKMETGGNK